MLNIRIRLLTLQLPISKEILSRIVLKLFREKLWPINIGM